MAEIDEASDETDSCGGMAIHIGLSFSESRMV